jgi:hypothetical protein
LTEKGNHCGYGVKRESGGVVNSKREEAIRFLIGTPDLIVEG